MSSRNSNIPEAKRTAELEELLIDAEADDEEVQNSHPILRRPWLLLLGLILVALCSLGAIVRHTLGGEPVHIDLADAGPGVV